MRNGPQDQRDEATRQHAESIIESIDQKRFPRNALCEYVDRFNLHPRKRGVKDKEVDVVTIIARNLPEWFFGPYDFESIKKAIKRAHPRMKERTDEEIRAEKEEIEAPTGKQVRRVQRIGIKSAERDGKITFENIAVLAYADDPDAKNKPPLKIHPTQRSGAVNPKKLVNNVVPYVDILANKLPSSFKGPYTFEAIQESLIEKQVKE
jgi:hypothetical protein